MHNTWIDAHRKSRRRPAEDLTADIADWQQAALRDQPRSQGCRPADVAVLERMAARRVIQALEALPQGHRMTVYYADVGGYRCREIAEILDIPVGTVMSRLHSARRKLRESLADVALARGSLAF